MSTANSTFPPILNPEDPYAYLPPVAAHELTVFTYVVCACAAVSIWTIVEDVPVYYKLFIKSRPSSAAFVYLISRIGVMFYTLFSLLFLTIGANNCLPFWVLLAIGWTLGSAFTSLLFLVRIWTLYRHNFVVVGFFVFMWLAVLGGSFTIGIGDGSNVGHFLPGSDFCTSNVAYPAYEGAGIIIPAVFDTLVFAAIAYRLYPVYDATSESTWSQRAGLAFTGGKGLSQRSRALLRGGQQYYVLSVIGNVITIAFYFSPSTPQPYRAMYPVILLLVTNAMACKLYRDVRFGVIDDGGVLDTLASRAQLRGASGAGTGAGAATGTTPDMPLEDMSTSSKHGRSEEV